MDGSRDWHRLFGLTLKDYLHGQPVDVQVEMDLSQKTQYLDVAIVRLRDEPLTITLPDGFDTFGPHNLISFKSFQEALDAWAMEELIGHYVNYRKQESPSMQELLPVEDFRLFAVCAHFPRGLARTATLAPVRDGVYEVSRFAGVVRVVVVGELPQTPHNAPLHLFSAMAEQRDYGARTYEPRTRGGTTLLLQLFEWYRKEGIDMPYTMEDLEREAVKTALRLATTEQRLEGVPAAQRLEGVPMEELLKALSPEAIEELRRRLAGGGEAK